MSAVIIVGAGLSGCVIARCLADNGYDVAIYERKNHIGGAIYDYVNSVEVMVHEYGPHIFHTNSDEAYGFIKKFSEWHVFRHRVQGEIKGQLCPIPFNFTSIEKIFTHEKAEIYKQKLIQNIGLEKTVTIEELGRANDDDLKQLADFIYENVFLHYTIKQWGRKPEELGGDVMSRVPVRLSYKDEYFGDTYQLMPQNGYTEFLKKILDHEKIHLHLNCDADERIKIDDGKVFFDDCSFDDAIVYTGCIDRLLNYRHGVLPYRTLRFDFETKEWPFQPVSVVNYPNAPDFTRITEFGHFYPEKQYAKSTIMREYPMEYVHNSQQEPYYPIPATESSRLYDAYRKELNKAKNFFPAGRLGSYKYMNMDVAILEGLSLAEKIIAYKKENLTQW